MPKKLDRCVKKVTKSLKKYNRKGNPYAICKAAIKVPGRNKPDSAFNKTQLEKGIKVEMEHTMSRNVAKRIAKDHLAECPRYYLELYILSYYYFILSHYFACNLF